MPTDPPLPQPPDEDPPEQPAAGQSAYPSLDSPPQPGVIQQLPAAENQLTITSPPVTAPLPGNVSGNTAISGVPGDSLSAHARGAESSSVQPNVSAHSSVDPVSTGMNPRELSMNLDIFEHVREIPTKFHLDFDEK